MRYVCAECGERSDRAGYCARDGKPIEATEDPIVGSEVGRYRVARLLAEGGMGRVYLGVQPTIGSRVAIKILADSTSPDLLDRFFAEARAVNLIRHESIVSVIDMAKLDDGRPYIVMEYIEGATLASIVKAGGAPLGGVVQVMLEVLSALAAAHQIGIVHRDLKPDNVLVTNEGHAKVLDFGIAKLLPGISNQLSPRTRTGALLGTPAYMAPEQISGSGQIDPRTDIYAAGIVFFEAVTGRVPFVGETLFDLMRMHLEVAPPSPRALRPELPAPLEGVILTALAKNPAQRFQSALAMAQALQHASNELRPEDWRSLSTRGAIITGGRASTHISKPHKPTTATPTPRQGRPARATVSTRGNLMWIIGIAATAAIAVLVTVLVMRRAPEPTNVVATPATLDATEAPIAEVKPGDAPATPAPATPSPPTPAKTRPATPTPTSPTSPAPVTPGMSKKQITVPADYNAKKVDPMAYLPKAIALAQQLYPDAKLTRFDFVPVRASGVADLTMKDAEGSYWFRSPLHSKRPVDVPRNVPVDRPCMIYVELEATQVTARIVDNDECNANLVRVPKCKVADVWKQALAIGVPGDHVAKVSWLFDEKWFFDSDLANSGGGETTSFEDRCP
ncbi:MAG: serine/threonine protein kinase [Myxococcota bacterium]|nr:serine/threonine protein kinase [Myxococcota bacterium]